MENLQFRQALVDICNDFGQDDLEKLKFLLKDVTESAKLESSDLVIDLFSAIERNKHVSLRDGQYLAECFCLMERKDLVKMLNFVPASIQKEMETSPRISPFRSLLYSISADLTEKEYNQMRLYCINTLSFKRRQLEKVKNVFDLFVLLERDTYISPTSTTVLKDMMRSLDRGNLLDLINKYQEKYHQLMDCESNPDAFSTNTGTVPISSPDEACMGLPTGTNMNAFTDLSSSQTSNRSTNSMSVVDVYEMTAHPRGLCIIINNSNFCQLTTRIGSDIDASKLKNTFDKLGFQTKIHPDLKAKDMVDVLTEVSRLDHSKYNALIVCILSHGNENVVYGIDEESVSVCYLTMIFQSSKCKTLENKPKLFFIQACQGQEKQTGLNHSDLSIQTDGSSEEQQQSFPETDANEITSTDTTKIILDECDFLIGFATVIGYASFRSRFKGSFYIEKLTENLDKYADSTDLVTLLIKVNNDVSEENIPAGKGRGIKKQVPMPQYTLRKQLYFSPDNLPKIYSQCSEESLNNTSDFSS